MSLFRTSSLALILLILSYSNGARGGPTIKVVGDRYYHPQSPRDYLQTYVILPTDHTSSTSPVAVGIELTDGFVAKASKLPMQSMEIPIGPSTFFNFTGFEIRTTSIPLVGTNPFPFVYWSYNLFGHPPVGVYDKAHFDFHFMFPTPENWWDQEWTSDSHGPCMGGSNETFFKTFKPIPAKCWPGGSSRNITQVGDFVWAMGSHLFDLAAPEFNPPRHFNFTQIYGQYDGEIKYFEAMVTEEVMKRPRGYKECKSLLDNPMAMTVSRDLPGEMCLERKVKVFSVEYRSFSRVPGSCGPLTAETAKGAYPAPAAPVPPNLCSLPAPVAA
ncbi:hypothetical protein Vretifemale_12190 [Volvox reticuliferus]|uniref:DUF1996 domain-containing protein n=1 Tax=Volvox reticuliferus TaxID=1737510 RepID=A0A8J4CHV5_9CHLO|nr:hypothetical protein Vretifemale_12190 [Volvox reticuliferus]GIL83360.1 hypothetical protein Vretifemale_12190 [Volvox reticuliferus]